MIETKTASISRLNDMLRTQGIGGRVVATPGILNLGHETRANVLQAIKTYASFDQDDDPYNQHDFGAVDVAGERFFFKIDYYDLNLQFGSEDPSDPEKTTRIMTIMRADEY